MALCKVYRDFSHFVAKPIESRKSDKPREVLPKTDFDWIFDGLYETYVEKGFQNNLKQRPELYKRICYDMYNVMGFDSDYAQVKEKVHHLLNNKAKAELRRLERFDKKASMLKEYWTHFATITYNDKYMDEETFQKKLRQWNNNQTKRFGWIFAGKFERGEKDGRLHFHALIHMVPGTSFGRIEHKKEYNPLSKKMEERYVNVELDEKFGRTDFVPINQVDLIHGNVAEYVCKYTNKSNGETYYSRGIPTEMVMDIDDDEIACTKKYEIEYLDKETDEKKVIEKVRYVLKDNIFKESEEEAFDVKVFALHRRIDIAA